MLVFPFGLLSHYLRCLMLARHLRPYFQVLFAHDDKFVDFVAKEDFQTFSCLDMDSAEVLGCVKKFDFSWINEEALERVYLDQVRVISLLKPVAVLGDTSLTLKMAAEKTGVPYISLMNGYMSKYYSFTRKISRTHPVHKLLKNFPGYLADTLTQKGEAYTFFWMHRPFKKLRRKHLLSSKRSYLDELEGDINLLCDLDEIFPQKAAPSNYRQIAPLYYDSVQGWEALPDQLDKSKRTIFVSMGSSGDWEKVSFLNHSVFSRYNVITAADAENVLDAEHIIRMPFVNVHTVFSFTDLVICHGGNGTIYQALLYGIPLLCSTSHLEQEWNTDALERLHLGKSLDGICSLEDYVQTVEEWLKQDKKPNGGYKHKIAGQVQKLQTDMKSLAAEILEPHCTYQH